ncbi:MAG: 3-dehydroquinate synthase [Thiotrichales bacterium]|nr:3-dehydroquinate synthase [Thiotrichales bacterium]
MKTLTVDLGDRSYPIYIGAALLDDSTLLEKHISGQQVLVVTNDRIAPLYLDKILHACRGFQCRTYQLADGERYKSLESLEAITTELLTYKYNRGATLLALGGGVVGDITGFVAATYQRGIDFIQIPTTLLAQVDSSVGGKTAVNHRLGKNMIGAFHQPVAVIADTTVLQTLNDRELRAGLAEVIKYGLIRDAGFFDWLEENIAALLDRDARALAHAIEVSCRNKAGVVAEDEREAGLRAILNLGHTFGHAIETAQNYQGWLHGEAVAAGMLLAADVSARLGWIEQQDLERVHNILHNTGLPVRLPEGVTAETMLEHMAVDKKNRDGRLTLILLEAIGSAVIRNDIDHKLIRATINDYQ